MKNANKTLISKYTVENIHFWRFAVENHKTFKYPGGVPASLVRPNQQWDFRYNVIEC